MSSPGIFHPIESNRLSDKAVRQIKELVEQGVLKPGDKLPPERELIKQLAVSRTSLREALRILEALGLIEVRPGLGAFVLDTSLRDLTTLWKSRLIEHQQQVLDLLEVREALEPKAAALAAERVSESDLERIARTLDKMAQSAADTDVDLAIQADIEFHDLLCRSTHNEFLIQLSDSISHALLEVRFAFFQQPGRIETSLQQHRQVFEAVKQRNPQAAAAAMFEHVRDSKQAVQQIR